MAFSEDATVVAGNPTKKSEYDTIADNTDWLQDQLKLQHDLDISTSTGRHLDTTPLSDSAKDLGTAALRWRVVYADTLGDTGQALAITAGTNAINLTAGDLTLYDATNNADTSLSIGTSATERLLVQVLNGAANQSAESVNIVSQTAAAGANAGQITIGVDDATILTIDDGGINAILGATTAAAATVTTLTASSTVNISTATNWQLGGVAYTGSMANLNTLRDDSMADALHRHSELSASDGTPNPAVQVDAAGNVGVGVVPEAWRSVYNTMQIGYSGLVAAGSGTNQWMYVGENWYADAADVRTEYLHDGAASAYQQTAGAHGWLVAPAGTANALLTFTQAMTLTNAGQLLVGHTASVAAAGNAQAVQIHTGGSTNLALHTWSADANEPRLVFAKSRSATKGSFAIVADNDVLGSMFAFSDDGTDLATPAAGVILRVNGTPAANDIPGEIELATYDGAAQTGSLILDAAGDLTLSSTVAAAVTYAINAPTGQNTSVQWQENTTARYELYYGAGANYLALWTTDSDGGGTDADVIRIPDGQLTVDGNSTFDSSAFDMICVRPSCGWHGPEGTEACPLCGSPVEWHDDVELCRVATHTLRQDPVALSRLEKFGIINTYGGQDLFISMNKAPWFLMSALVQERDLREEQEASLRKELALLQGRLEQAESELRALRS